MFSKTQFNIFAGLLGVIVLASIVGLSYSVEGLRRSVASFYPSDIPDEDDFNQTTSVPSLNRKTRELGKHCKELYPIPKCICEYCSTPPEERCVKWCSENNEYCKKE